MLPQDNRLKRKKEFETVFKGGRILKGKYLFLKYLGNGTDKTKVGFIVSKKVSKSAVSRNRAKRLMREAVRLRKKEIKEGLSMIFIALPPIKGRPFKEVDAEVASLLEKIK